MYHIMLRYNSHLHKQRFACAYKIEIVQFLPAFTQIHNKPQLRVTHIVTQEETISAKGAQEKAHLSLVHITNL